MVSPYLDEEIPHPQARPPGHAPLIDRLQVLERGERWRWSELLYGSLSCRGRDKKYELEWTQGHGFENERGIKRSERQKKST